MMVVIPFYKRILLVQMMLCSLGCDVNPHLLLLLPSQVRSMRHGNGMGYVCHRVAIRIVTPVTSATVVTTAIAGKVAVA